MCILNVYDGFQCVDVVVGNEFEQVNGDKVLFFDEDNMKFEIDEDESVDDEEVKIVMDLMLDRWQKFDCF